ncbi:MAG: toll/interleukin-1 receptor domain-containing protein [Chitinophagaceae bacterium]|nr:toll/interleukin-1 receptor domain-containing protein [Chitinophagaceae bacterium]
MFITLQFPLFDRRFFEVDPNRTEKPKWPEPGMNDRVRYFGDVLSRNKPYLGPWDDEKKYCNAGSVINFCGLQEAHFFKLLHNAPYEARILFRRFQSDGRCLAKFELGFNDAFEQVAQTPGAHYSFDGHIQQYLLCPVKIKIGNRLSEYLPLIESGGKLKTAYYWTTSKGKRTFDMAESNQHVDGCEPVLLIQVDAGKMDLRQFTAQKVEAPFLEKEGIQLFFRHIPYKIGRRNYNIKAWIIAGPGNSTASPVYSRDFSGYNTVLRYLRINLLRIHTEISLQKKLVEALGDTDITSSDQKKRLYFYLHKILLNLTNIQRNKQPQTMLVESAFRLDELYGGSMRIEDQINILEEYKSWLSDLDVTPKNQQVIGFVEKSTTGLQQQQQVVVFISYNHADKTAADMLKNRLEKEGVTVILDSASMQAGTAINDFISKSILRADAILSVVSVNSLTSGWVGVETINTIFIRNFFPEKKFIPCALDNSFFEDNFVDKALLKIDARLSELRDHSVSRAAKGMRFTDYDDEQARLSGLSIKLPDIVKHLKADLCIDISGANLDTNFSRILDTIKA